MSKKLIEEIDGEDANASLNLKVSEVSIKTSKQQKEDEKEIGRESEREKEVISEVMLFLLLSALILKQMFDRETRKEKQLET